MHRLPGVPRLSCDLRRAKHDCADDHEDAGHGRAADACGAVWGKQEEQGRWASGDQSRSQQQCSMQQRKQGARLAAPPASS